MIESCDSIALYMRVRRHTLFINSIDFEDLFYAKKEALKHIKTVKIWLLLLVKINKKEKYGGQIFFYMI